MRLLVLFTKCQGCTGGGASRPKYDATTNLLHDPFHIQSTIQSPKMPELSHQALTQPIKSAASTSWTYPFKGVYFFFTHPPWWPLLGRRLLPLAIVSIVVFSFLFTFTYLPQVAFLALIGHGPGAWLNALFLVLGEGAVVIALLFEALLVDETLVDVFDAVFLSQDKRYLLNSWGC